MLFATGWVAHDLLKDCGTFILAAAWSMAELTVKYFSHSSDYQILGSSHVTSKKPVTSIWLTKFNYAHKIHQTARTLSFIQMDKIWPRCMATSGMPLSQRDS